MKRKREKRWSDKRKREREGSIDARVETVKKRIYIWKKRRRKACTFGNGLRIFLKRGRRKEYCLLILGEGNEKWKQKFMAS